jgi:hypothetical protein
MPLFGQLAHQRPADKTCCAGDEDLSFRHDALL